MIGEIEVIFFDVNGTLRGVTRKSQAEILDLVGQMISILGIDVAVEVFAQRLTERYQVYKQWSITTRKTANEIEFLTKWLLPDIPQERVSRHASTLNQLFRESTGTRKAFPETHEVLLQLFRRGYRLGIVSNTISSVEVPAMLKEMELSGMVEVMLLSAVEGKRKPDPTILMDAASRMGVEPRCCAYVGNKPENDVAPARLAGFGRTIILQNPTRLELPPQDADLAPDHTIQNLLGLLDIFPTRTAPPKPAVYDVAFSTMWAKKNFPVLGDFCRAAMNMGFARIELNHQVTSVMLESLDPAVYPISSIHEPCPADISMESLRKRDWLISSLDEDNRQLGVEAVKRSIDLAQNLKAGYIVIHVGACNSERHLEKQLRTLFEQDKKGSVEYQEIFGQITAERAMIAGPHFTAVQKSMRELLDYAADKGVRLGVENRYHYLEFPSPDEMETLLGLAGPDQIGFVYDVGHAETLDRLGFYPHTEWLRRFAPRMIGTHLHDVVGLTDHFSPGLGSVDFSMVASYLPPQANRVCEFQTFNSPEQVKNGLRYLQSHGCIQHLIPGEESHV